MIWWSGSIGRTMDATDSMRVIVTTDPPSETGPAVKTMPFSYGEVSFTGIPVGTQAVVRLEGFNAPDRIMDTGTTGPWNINREKFDLYLDTGAISPLPPESLSIQVISSDQIAVSWRDVSHSESGYLVQRRTGAGQFDSLILLPQDSETYIDMHLPASTVFSYRVMSTCGGRYSMVFDTLTDSTPTPRPPTLLELDTAAVRAILDSNGLRTMPGSAAYITDTAAGETRVVALILNSTTLGTDKLTMLPAALSRLNALTSLQLGGNNLTALPPQIGALTGLRVLNISGNRITALPPEIGSLSRLVNFNASNNLIAFLPDEIGTLTALSALQINSNVLNALPDTMASLVGIGYLDFDGNAICSLSQRIIDWLTAIQWYDADWKARQNGCP